MKKSKLRRALVQAKKNISQPKPGMREHTGSVMARRYLNASTSASENGTASANAKFSPDASGSRSTPTGERLVSVAIKRRGVIIHEGGFQSHGSLRSSLGDEDPYNGDRHRPDDIPGFATNEGNFLTRKEAVPVAVAAGQLTPDWLTVRRELLSSDLNW